MAPATANLLFLGLLLLTAASSTPASATTLTLHNLCPYPVWPLVTPNTGFPSISDNTGRLDGGGRGLVSFPFPPGFWSGRVVARTGCGSGSSSAVAACETGASPPATVVQLAVHAEGRDLAAYSVSLVDGFNVPAVVSPQAVGGGGQCPALGCAADLNAGCPRAQRVVGARGSVVACRGPAGYFKERCPLTRTTPADVEPVPQRCFGPGELKVVFCQPAMVNAAAADAAGEATGRIRTVVADD
ncbi:osmotin-like protein [Panicum miliaceum]|uniref:Osmotin-like protein n=1 Tax=Panicum miliaceum TaxID=4540 RepID=A0A3L6T1G2_PANMI|nr:osmotin-like protein [Panicum miliaceum]